MTSSNGNIFRVTGPLCGPGEFPTQRPVTRSFDVFFDMRPNKRLSKQSWGWWFETPSLSLWRHRNDLFRTRPQWVNESEHHVVLKWVLSGNIRTSFSTSRRQWKKEIVWVVKWSNNEVISTYCMFCWYLFVSNDTNTSSDWPLILETESISQHIFYRKWNLMGNFIVCNCSKVIAVELYNWHDSCTVFSSLNETLVNDPKLRLSDI